MISIAWRAVVERSRPTCDSWSIESSALPPWAMDNVANTAEHVDSAMPTWCSFMIAYVCNSTTTATTTAQTSRNSFIQPRAISQKTQVRRQAHPLNVLVGVSNLRDVAHGLKLGERVAWPRVILGDLSRIADIAAKSIRNQSKRSRNQKQI